MWRQLKSSFNDLVWKAALSLGFFLGLRASEYAWDPRVGPIKLAPGLDRIHIYYSQGDLYLDYIVPRSKTKPHGFQTSTVCSGVSECCPCAMKLYLKMRREMFGCLIGGLFVFEDGSLLTKSKLTG